MDPGLWPSDELPVDARQAVTEAEADLERLRAEAGTRIHQVRQRADEAIAELQDRRDQAIREAEEELEQAVRARTLQLAQVLYPLQVAYAKEGLLDQALAIRARLRQLRDQMISAEPDPGTLANFRPEQDGTVVVFDVVGGTEGTVWGTDVYTSDSRLAAACVHAGVLGVGERGLVRVTILDGINIGYVGSQRHGVRSHDYGDYPVAYRVRRA